MPSLLPGDGRDKDEPRMVAGGLEGGMVSCQSRRRSPNGEAGVVLDRT